MNRIASLCAAASLAIGGLVFSGCQGNNPDNANNSAQPGGYGSEGSGTYTPSNTGGGAGRTDMGAGQNNTGTGPNNTGTGAGQYNGGTGAGQNSSGTDSNMPGRQRDNSSGAPATQPSEAPAAQPSDSGGSR